MIDSLVSLFNRVYDEFKVRKEFKSLMPKYKLESLLNKTGKTAIRPKPDDIEGIVINEEINIDFETLKKYYNFKFPYIFSYIKEVNNNFTLNNIDILRGEDYNGSEIFPLSDCIVNSTFYLRSRPDKTEGKDYTGIPKCKNIYVSYAHLKDFMWINCDLDELYLFVSEVNQVKGDGKSIVNNFKLDLCKVNNNFYNSFIFNKLSLINSNSISSFYMLGKNNPNFLGIDWIGEDDKLLIKNTSCFVDFKAFDQKKLKHLLDSNLYPKLNLYYEILNKYPNIFDQMKYVNILCSRNINSLKEFEMEASLIYYHGIDQELIEILINKLS